MKHYTDIIPLPLAEKLKEKGMPIEMRPLYAPEAPNARGIVKAGVGLRCPSYAEVFDWLMSDNRQIIIVIEPSFYEPYLGKVYNKDGFEKGFDGNTWHEAANAAIEKALTLI